MAFCRVVREPPEELSEGASSASSLGEVRVGVVRLFFPLLLAGFVDEEATSATAASDVSAGGALFIFL